MYKKKIVIIRIFRHFILDTASAWNNCNDDINIDFIEQYEQNTLNFFLFNEYLRLFIFMTQILLKTTYV